ncbi:hypothetical protein [Archangium minus]|uniref:hypothetical protein n=1 Tax=Archangium minus TaxID=83450 RepID=UPI0037C1A537
MLRRPGGVCHARPHPNGDLVKYFCEACERLVPPASYRLEFGLLVVKCSRCKVEMRCGPDQDEEPAPTASKSSAGGPLIMLGQSEVEPDPIENEPTRRVAVPASVLAAIEAEAQESRRKKAKESGPAKTPPPEPAAAKAAPPKLAMSEAAAASNLMVLRLSEMKSRDSAPASTQAAPEVPAAPVTSSTRPSTTQLRVVPDAASSSTPAAASSPSAPEDPFMPPAGYCPKCIGPRKDGAVVCPFCGLEYARFRVEEFRPSPVLSSTWLGVVELWDSKGAHDKVLALASERGELAGLGRLYRIRLARNPEDAMAKRGREEVLRLASAGSVFMPTAPPDKRAKMRMAGLGVLFFILVVMAVFMGAQVRRMLMTGGGP